MQFVRLSHRAARTQVITCMETLKKNVEEEDAVTSLVVGTESRYTSSPSLLFSVGPLSFVHSAQRLRSADPDCGAQTGSLSVVPLPPARWNACRTNTLAGTS